MLTFLLNKVAYLAVSADHVYLFFCDQFGFLSFPAVFLLHVMLCCTCSHVLYQDVVMRRQTEDARRRLKSEMSTALHYPSYLDSGPDYEAEMRYFSGDTLSPRDKVKLLASFECVVYV